MPTAAAGPKKVATRAGGIRTHRGRTMHRIDGGSAPDVLDPTPPSPYPCCMHATRSLALFASLIAATFAAGCGEPDDDDGGDATAADGSSTGGDEGGPGSSTGAGDDGTSAAADSGEAGSGTDAGSEDGGSSTGGTGAHAITGQVHRDRAAVLAEGNDGVGTLYVGVFPGCDPAAALAGFAVVPAADVTDPATEVAFMVANLPDGEYDVRVFLDDDGDADALAPMPDAGDLVADPDPTDAGASCSHTVVDGGDAAIEVVLGLVLPPA